MKKTATMYNSGVIVFLQYAIKLAERLRRLECKNIIKGNNSRKKKFIHIPWTSFSEFVQKIRNLTHPVL